jgi:hypothetical protein
MTVARMHALGKDFECSAKPYLWPHGIGVTIEIATGGERVGAAQILCARDRADYPVLSVLSDMDLCEIALSRFVAGELAVSLEGILSWERSISGMGQKAVSPLICGFSHAKHL